MLLGTYWGTQWELETHVDGNILETTKIQPLFPLTLPQKTKTWVPGVHVVGSPHWVPRISVPILARSCWNSMGVSGWFKKLVEHSVWFWAGFFKFLKLYLVMTVFFKRSPNSSLVGKLESGLMRSPWLWPQTLNLSSRMVEAITWSTSTSSGCTVVIGVGSSCLWVGYANARFRFSPVTFFSMCWLALPVFPGWSSPFRSFHCGSFALCQWRVVSEHLARLVIQLH